MAKSAFPKVVVQTWQEIWRYFEGPTDMDRTFGTDFEEYVGEDLVRIHIAVRERS